jgi:hypothetical protein
MLARLVRKWKDLTRRIISPFYQWKAVRMKTAAAVSTNQFLKRYTPDKKILGLS